MTRIDERPDWQNHANCLTADPDLFFPQRGDMDSLAQAVAICSNCPVRTECLDYALANHEQHGIWGGLAPRARRGYRRQRASAA